MGMIGGSASAAESRLSPAQCYLKDSGCTKFCARVTKVSLRYECFKICDRMLDRCLEHGVWSDSFEQDPDAGVPDPRDPTGPQAELLETFMRMTMTLADTDGDGDLSPEEMESAREKVFGDANVDPKAPAD
jgi:hypothetical protein